MRSVRPSPSITQGRHLSVSQMLGMQEVTAGLVWLPPAHLTGQYSQPLDLILGLLGNELDALKDIGDVIDAPFLHFQHLSCPVQVNNTVS